MMNHERENENSFQYLKALRDLQRTPNSPEAQDAMERAKEHHRGHTDSQCTSEADLLKALAPSWLCYVEAVPGRRIPSADIARAEAKAIETAEKRLQGYARQLNISTADVVRRVEIGVLTPSVILAALDYAGAGNTTTVKKTLAGLKRPTLDDSENCAALLARAFAVVVNDNENIIRDAKSMKPGEIWRLTYNALADEPIEGRKLPDTHPLFAWRLPRFQDWFKSTANKAKFYHWYEGR